MRKNMMKGLTGPDLRNHDKTQEMYLRGKKAIAQLIQMPSGRLETRIAVPGQARTLLGFAFAVSPFGAGATPFNPVTQFILALNNDIIVQNGAVILFTPAIVTGNIFPGEYYRYMRPLTGADTLIITTICPVPDTFPILFQFHYSEV